MLQHDVFGKISLQGAPDRGLFLYQQVLGIELPRLDALRAKRPKRLPAVLSAEEVRRFLDVFAKEESLFRLMASLLYGTGLRRQESCQLRVHDLDLVRRQVTVRHGKGDPPGRTGRRFAHHPALAGT
jgi:integrase